MKKFKAVNKRSGKEFVVVVLGEDKYLTIESSTGKEKEIKAATIKRHFVLGEEIVPEVKKEEIKKEAAPKKKVIKVKKQEQKKEDQPRKHSRSALKKDGSVRTDKFKPKLTAEIVSEIKTKLAAGEKQAHLAREYGVSNQTIRCLRFGWMWKEVQPILPTQENIGA
ncbi:helix-turn-helix domain-containing protein [Fictibacillus sp. NRS-1165]|uniref:helix-turn-helix domain-containing protein n=1 Tax=Fictibacillus sp. NRS-1165 TaxID=3144463 RepID=UPI003D20CEBB